jgi:two-component system, LuxR family, response regulator FixJ
MLDESPPRKVHIVDDDDAVRDSMRALLESLGFDVHDYSSARDFLNRGGERSKGCLLLDLHMPIMSGIDLLEHMQSEGVILPTIVITGRGDPMLRERALRSGALALIDKPVTDEVLLTAITRAFAE